jgi:hypothetical protein
MACFGEAIKALNAGKKVTVKDWQNTKVIFLGLDRRKRGGPRSCIYEQSYPIVGNVGLSFWHANHNELLSDEWVVIDDR